jgi:hypothetical protein
MNNEISEEAKRALADLPRRRAAERLGRDGAHSIAAVQRRVRAIAQERNLPPADIAKMMHKRIITKHALAFCEKHKISLDWLLCGDLAGLQRMTRERKLRDQAVPQLSDRIMQKYCSLSPVFQAIIEETVDRLLEKQK